MMSWLIVYLIGVIVGIIIDIIFWIGVAKYREIANEQKRKRNN
tara:strand:+ start:635 stop:763 length:129 start_codon:yes stop_codon:yes gene_type:complete